MAWSVGERWTPELLPRSETILSGRRASRNICENGGRRQIAQQMANHESARTTGLYDRRDDEVSLDEVERIVI
jgi:hypothetical protein